MAQLRFTVRHLAAPHYTRLGLARLRNGLASVCLAGQRGAIPDDASRHLASPHDGWTLHGSAWLNNALLNHTELLHTELRDGRALLDYT